MRGCLRILAGLVALVFIISTILMFFLFNLTRVAGDRQAVKQAIDGEGLLRETLVVLVNQAVQQQAEATGLPPIDPAVLRRSVNQVILSGWVQDQTDAAVDAIFDYLETETMSSPELVINVGPFMTSLRGEPGRQALLTFVQALPICTAAQLQPDFQSGRFEIPLCVPPGVDVPLMTTLLQNGVNQLLDAYPALVGDGIIRWRILDDTAVPPQIRTGFEQFRTLYQFSRGWVWLFWLIPLFSLCLILILDVRSLASFGHWWGWPMLLAAVATIVLSFYIPYLTEQYFRAGPVWAQFGLAGPAISRFLLAVLHSLMGLWLRRVSLQAAVLIVVAAFFIVIGFLGNALTYGRRPEPQVYWETDNYWDAE